jgi:hypothetical protein
VYDATTDNDNFHNLFLHTTSMKEKKKKQVDEPQMPQKSERTPAASAYQQIAPSAYYRTGAHPPTVANDMRRQQPNHAPDLRTIHLSTDLVMGAPITTRDDSAISKTWHDEWEIEPKQFGPTRPLTLLNQPAHINLRTHPRDAKRVYLNHWDREHEPDGTSTQRLILERKQAEVDKQAVIQKAGKKEERRRKVKQAARISDVVDLTGEDISERARGDMALSGMENCVISLGR